MITFELSHSLATYGTLAPGRSNAGQLSELQGRWFKGTVRGQLRPQGWGAAEGYPGMTPDPEGQEIAVDVFISNDLPSHWPRLDDFEGDGYVRIAVSVRFDDGDCADCYIYALRADDNIKEINQLPRQ